MGATGWNDLSGTTALVTGAAGGIGAAVSRGLVEAGAGVYGLDVAAPEKPHGKHLQCDVTDPAAVRASVDRAAVDGGLDITVLVAGRFPNRPLEQWSPEEFADLWRLNVGGAFNTLQAALPYLRRSGRGRAVALSSSAIHLAVPGFAPYGATKAALVGLIRGVAAEAAGDGVTANVITPGLTATAAALSGDVAPFFDPVVQGQLVQRRLEPEDLVGGVLYLCSSAASMVSGQVLNIDGGGAMH